MTTLAWTILIPIVLTIVTPTLAAIAAIPILPRVPPGANAAPTIGQTAGAATPEPPDHPSQKGVSGSYWPRSA
jgi:hypothetical protein